jgi:hypothetical protein
MTARTVGANGDLLWRTQQADSSATLRNDKQKAIESVYFVSMRSAGTAEVEG